MKLNSKKLQKAAEKFTGLMIKRITEVSGDWQKPWLPVKRKDYLPRNITGRFYSGGNTFMLLTYSLYFDFSTPVFLTFLQADKAGIRIRKGASSFPVYHIAYMYYNPQNQDRISIEKFEAIEDETVRSGYYLIPTPKCYDVFNLDQTDYNEKYPEEWAALQARHRILPDIADKSMYTHEMLDGVISKQTWVCPIEERFSNRAYYSPGEDRIVLPYKMQFDSGVSYYGTALHEMIHSTGHEERLNRIKKGASKGTDSYAREELVAELSAALMGFYMGIETTIRADHANYLKTWLDALHTDNSFLMDVLTEVVQAIKFMCTHLQYNPFETGQEVAKPEYTTHVTPGKTIKKALRDELVIID